MHSWHRTCGFLIIGLLFTAGLLPQAAGQSRRDREVARQLAAGASAYEDGLLSAAERFFEQALRRSRSPEQIQESTLWLVSTLYRRHRYEQALALLDDEFFEQFEAAERPRFRMWRARLHYALGAFETVIDELTAVDPSHLSTDEMAQRLRIFGRAYAQTGRFESAARVFELYDQQHADTREAPANLLDWAGVLLDMPDLAEAETLLEELLVRYPDSTAALTARLWLSVLWIDQGRSDEALPVLLDLIASEPIPSDRVAEAWYAKARLEEQASDYAEALLSLQHGQAAAAETAMRERGRILEARVLLRADRANEGIERLRAIVAEAPGHPVSAEAQLELADALLALEQYDEALRAFQDYLEVFEDAEGRATALLGRAWSLLGLRRPVEAASSFEQAYALHPGLMERQQALFKVADSYFSNRQYARAREEYLLLTQVFPGSDLVPMALFQAAESLARQQRMDEALSEFRAIEDAFPGTPFAERAALRMGTLHEEAGAWERAMSAYNRLMETYPNGNLFAEALHRRGMIRYRSGRFQQALEDFERVVQQYPQHRGAEQAYFMRGWSLYLLGQNEEALAVSASFLQRYPYSRWLPDVTFWLGSYHFNQATYEEAERHFLDVITNHPDGELADQALYWAGRSAMAQAQYLRAIDHFSDLARRFPSSPIMPSVRFAQGDALSQLGEFAGSILAFQEVIRRYPESPIADAAWGRKGDNQFTLGAENPARYREALVSFQTVLDSSSATPALKLQAEYKLGRTLERLGQPEEALTHYLQVVYDFQNDRTLRGAEAVLWFTRAAFLAASLEEAQGGIETAIQILNRVVAEEVPAAPDAALRIERLRQRTLAS